jgi:hypothetical protein
LCRKPDRHSGKFLNLKLTEVYANVLLPLAWPKIAP